MIANFKGFAAVKMQMAGTIFEQCGRSGSLTRVTVVPNANQSLGRSIGEDEIRSFLIAKPLVDLLYQTVREFFRESLQIVRQIPGTEASSVYYGDLPKPANILLTLCTDSGNVSAALAHELLHLRTAIDDFPVRIAIDLAAIEPGIYTNIGKINNILGHIIFHDVFVSLGFQSQELVADSGHNGDPEEWKLAAKKHLQSGHPQVRGAWLACYLNEIVSRSFGWPNLADQVLAGGRELFPSRMDEDAQWLAVWLERGDFKSPYQYISSLNTLLGRIGFPIPKMERLHSSPSGLEFVGAN
jgi:hypothetical protein